MNEWRECLCLCSSLCCGFKKHPCCGSESEMSSWLFAILVCVLIISGLESKQGSHDVMELLDNSFAMGPHTCSSCTPPPAFTGGRGCAVVNTHPLSAFYIHFHGWEAVYPLTFTALLALVFKRREVHQTSVLTCSDTLFFPLRDSLTTPYCWSHFNILLC